MNNEDPSDALTIKIKNIGDGFIATYDLIDLDQGCGGGGFFAASTMNEVMEKIEIMSQDKTGWFIDISYDPRFAYPYFEDGIKEMSQAWFDGIKNPKPKVEKGVKDLF